MVVALVYLQMPHQVVERGVDDMLLLRVVELRDIEYHRVDLRQVEFESLVEERGVGGIEYEAAGIDAAIEVDVAVLVHHQFTGVGVDDHLLAVAEHEFLHAVHIQRVGREVELGIVLLGRRLEYQCVIVVVLAFGAGLGIVHQLVVDIHLALSLVVRHKARLGQRVYHRLGLHNIHLDGLGKLVHKEVVCHITHLHISIHAQHRVDLVDALNLAELALRVVAVRLERRVALVARRAKHCEVKLILVHLPNN